MNFERIEDIIDRHLLGETSESENVALLEWRNVSDENEITFQKYKSIHEFVVDYNPEVSFSVENAYQKHLSMLQEEVNIQSSSSSSSSSTRIFSIQRLSAIAAVFLVIFGATYFFSNSTTTYHASDRTQFVALEDGTSIWLEKGSSLTANKDFGHQQREVTIKGKAFFDVARNENIPFNIHTESMDVQVLGTSFTVDAEVENPSVAVKSGMVKVVTANNEISLNAGEKAIVQLETLSRTVTSSEDINWRNASLSFENAPLTQVIADINLYHNERIILNSAPDNQKCLLTATSLINEDFSSIIKVLQSNYDLQIVEKGNSGQVILDVKSCY